ncbi:BTAD domain-containing putative transcriptional regulator [Pseudactinotalea sp. Z1732]|uniref:BTAD domain-containing putative transcriptional regulator n=1 Tax=Pseudactinotalea sp. Z1732 TaxID=3413026 RepID=UPI003C7BF3EF
MAPTRAAHRPPALQGLVARVPAEQLLRLRGPSRPLITVTAAPGWGKTTVVGRWASAPGTRWLTLGAQHGDATRLARELARLAHRDEDGESSGADAGHPPDTTDVGVLAHWVARSWAPEVSGPIVLDHAHVLIGTPGHDLLRRLVRSGPTRPQICVLSRCDLDLVDDRDRGAGTVLELSAAHLALDADAVAYLLDADPEPDRALAARIAEGTGGWPAMVRIVLDGLESVPPRERSARLSDLLGAGGTAGNYVVNVVLPAYPEPTLSTLSALALTGPIDAAGYGRAVGLSAGKASTEALTPLVRRGLARLRYSEPAPEVTLSPLIARSVTAYRLMADSDHHLVERVTTGLVEAGDVVRGLGVLVTARRGAAIAELLREHGQELYFAGHLDLLCAAVDLVPPALRTADILLVGARALAYRGDWPAAMNLHEEAGDAGPGDPAVFGLVGGLIQHQRGKSADALEWYDRYIEKAIDPRVEAEIAGWSATCRWGRGELDRARELAARSSAAARATGDDRSLALAHTARALIAASDGDSAGNRAHYDLGLAAARRAGDALQEARILTNRGSLHMERGVYPAALADTEAAIDLAEGQSSVYVAGIARCNRAEIQLHVGTLDEAIVDAEIARDRFAAAGSPYESYALQLLAQIRAEQGELTLARGSYERAVRLAQASNDQQGQVAILVGLAKCIAGSDPEAAAAAARRAANLDDGMYLGPVLLARGWVALAAGDLEVARECATEAEATATARDERSVLAEAATLAALLDPDPAEGLQGALALWNELNARTWATRIELGIARRRAVPGWRARAAELERQLAAWGCAVRHGPFPAMAVQGASDTDGCVVRLLGQFTIEVAGQPVPMSAWGSRKARDLLKLLALRANRGATREELADALWPDQAYETVANRLSVALSVVRTVLAPGEQRRDDAPVLIADAGTVRIDPEQVDIDVAQFEFLATQGLAAARSGDRTRAVELLTAAEAHYGGDLLEHDQDSPWLIDRREEVRAVYLSVARTLADLCRRSDPDQALRLLLRVLDRDPYDETAHLAVCTVLMDSGQHGEARRRHRLYARRMGELDLPAVPFSDVVGH